MWLTFWLSFISIHALREEGDLQVLWTHFLIKHFYPRPPRGGRQQMETDLCLLRIISIHALREEGDELASSLPALMSLFLSTPSARRATLQGWSASAPSRYFYPRPPRGGRQVCQNVISSAAIFLSTPSARRATEQRHHSPYRCAISIHALREEGDRRTG